MALPLARRASEDKTHNVPRLRVGLVKSENEFIRHDAMDPSHTTSPAARITYQWVITACLTIVFCSCRGIPKHGLPHGAEQNPHFAPGGPAAVSQQTLPPEAWSGPLAALARDGSWRPPGIVGPWPRDEYLFDGGDMDRPTAVASDWTVTGLGETDTVAHYDTLDGRTLVESSNRVSLYAPRFGSVRLVEGTADSRGRAVIESADARLGLEQNEDLEVAATSLANRQLVGDVGVRGSSVYRERQQGGGFQSVRHVTGLRHALLPYEDLQIIHQGQFDHREEALLEEAVQAARTWSSDTAWQVVIDEQQAIVDTKDEKLQLTYGLEEPDSPKLRIYKVASAHSAKPGETVDFTLRFDNVGDQVIGNVTILDHLSKRLEFVTESDECSLKAEFVADPNATGSAVVRWEITDPLKPGEGGVIRFRCRVR